MANDSDPSQHAHLPVARCPLCGTIMTAERAEPLRFNDPIRSIQLPGEDNLRIEAGQTVTRLCCENDHIYWLIDDDADGEDDL